MKQRDLFDTQMELMDQLIDQKEPLWAEPKVEQGPTMHRLSDGHTVQMNDTYKVVFDKDIDTHLIVTVPCQYSKQPWAKVYKHANMNRRREKTLEFKHDNPKRWSQHAGCEIMFAVPVGKVMIPQQEKGYSYPVIMIAGMEIRLNAGGGGGATWTDHVSQGTSTCVGHSKQDLDRIASVSDPTAAPWMHRDELREQWMKEHENDLIVVSASRTDDRPGYVICQAIIGGKGSYKDAILNGDTFYVPQEEYGYPALGCAIDTARHERAMGMDHDSLDPVRSFLKENPAATREERWAFIQQYTDSATNDRGHRYSDHWETLAHMILDLR